LEDFMHVVQGLTGTRFIPANGGRYLDLPGP
jgi:hypothetical protein